MKTIILLIFIFATQVFLMGECSAQDNYKKLQKIEDIYDIEGFGFTYNLPEKYIGEKLVIYFKNHQTKEDLQNSPYTLINKNNENFNEARFLYSLSQPIYEEKIKNIYCPNSIGFLATDINLNDQCFMNFIHNSTFAHKT